MVLEDYMVNTCELKRKLGIDEDTLTLEWGPVETVKCFYYGDIKYKRESEGVAFVDGKHYLLTDTVNVGDIINGQTVQVVNNIPEFDGRTVLYDVITWV
jgi:hypothetical protein